MRVTLLLVVGALALGCRGTPIPATADLNQPGDRGDLWRLDTAGELARSPDGRRGDAVAAGKEAGAPATCPPAGGLVYYVSTGGSDSSPGSSAKPFRTITHAYQSHAAPGVTIVVMPGTYTDYQSGWGLHLDAKGAASNPIRLCSQTRGAAVIDGQNAADRNAAVYLDGSYNILDGFVITRGPKSGISVYGSGNQILNNEIKQNGNVVTGSGNGQCGIYSNTGTSENVYGQNFIHDNGRAGTAEGKLDHGLYLCGDSETVINNISVRNANIGLQIAGNSTVSNLKVYHNVFAHNQHGMVLWLAMSGVEIKNNLIVGNHKHGIYACEPSGSGVEIDHNLVFGNATLGSDYSNYALKDQCSSKTYSYTLGTTVAADPLFAGSGSFAQQSDYSLKPTSPAVDAGLALPLVTSDIVGTPRPRGKGWDIGGYEAY